MHVAWHSYDTFSGVRSKHLAAAWNRRSYHSTATFSRSRAFGLAVRAADAVVTSPARTH